MKQDCQKTAAAGRKDFFDTLGMKRRLVRLILPAALILGLSVGVLGGTAALHRDRGPKGVELVSTQGVYCTLKATELHPGAVIWVLTDEGAVIHTVRLDENRQALLGPLTPRNIYRLRFPDDREGDFFLAENAAVTALSGALKADGEVLYYK